MAKPKVCFVVGTRPDAIKSAPVVREMRRHADLVDTILISTGQHKEMLAQALGAFDLAPDEDLEVMKHGQTLADITADVLKGLEEKFKSIQPDMVFAQGDTTTTFTAGLASFYLQIPFGHIEAGLRTESVWSPFPEEFNRRAVSLFAAQHYAPTKESRDHLLQEGVKPETIFLTGNTGIDAVKLIAEQSQTNWYAGHPGRLILLTTHRRENWGEPQAQITRAALRLVERFTDVLLVVPMHRNPKVRETLTGILGGKPRVELIEPPEYNDFVPLMKRADLILTDSGGIQEEAPTFGIPVLVLRESTERPEGVTAGTAKLVGTDEEAIYREAMRLLDSEAAYGQMAQSVSPYGDGEASARIRYHALRLLGIDSPEASDWA